MSTDPVTGSTKDLPANPNLEHLRNDSRFEFQPIDINQPFDCGPVARSDNRR